ncbi:MAG: MBL fold metallo-hydrolase RNA specificity domain-containing protein [Candidatus Krumholzibacteriia bacterium]
MQLTFHGAAGTVTGSRHLLEAAGQRVLIDCGLFQGLKQLRRMNWDTPGFEPGFLDRVVLTHAHIDHTGYTPRLLQYGFKGPVHCTEPTAELLELMLMDSAHLQEEDAAWANKKGFSKHDPAEPLYTSVDALRTLKLIRPEPFQRWIACSEGMRMRYHNSGHILGAGFVEFRIKADRPDTVNPGELTVIFSGDVGRYDVPLHLDPEPLPACDVLIIESTYGNRTHDHEPVLEQIGEEFRRTVHKRGVILIPAFAVGRTQLVGLILRGLMTQGDLAEVPIHIDSPMAIDATLIYSRHLYDDNLDEGVTADDRSRLFPRNVKLHRTVHESKQLNTLKGPRVIIAASGMMTGGRILHHLIRRLPDHHNLILLSGYQAQGTRGRSLQDGADHLRMHGQNVPVHAKVATIDGLSSHADMNELMRWVSTAPQPPKRVFVVHGEEEQSSHLAGLIRTATGAEVTVPGLKDSFAL